jgi:hypothetical protein
MDTKLLGFTVLLLIAGVFYIATTSIGIKCSNDNPNYKENNKSNTGFLISQLVSAILVTLIAAFGIYLAVTDKDISMITGLANIQ